MRRIVLFDLYGTLVLTHKHDNAWTAWQEFLIGFAGTRGGKAKADDATALLDDFWRDDGSVPKNEMSIFESRLKRFSDRLSLSVSDGELRELANDLCGIWQEVLDIDPDAYEILPLIKGQTGLVTNFDHPPHIHKLVQSSGLGEFFKVVVVSGEEGTKKPNPEILLVACRRMGCEPRETIYVGDSIVDFQAAAGAGISPVIIRREGQKEVENSRESHSTGIDVESLILEKEKSGELQIVKNLREVPALLGR